jgi:hypothetical protein
MFLKMKCQLQLSKISVLSSRKQDVNYGNDMPRQPSQHVLLVSKWF